MSANRRDRISTRMEFPCTDVYSVFLDMWFSVLKVRNHLFIFIFFRSQVNMLFLQLRSISHPTMNILRRMFICLTGKYTMQHLTCAFL